MLRNNIIIIYPSQIEPLSSPGDFGSTGRPVESAFLKHLLETQPLIKSYEVTGDIHSEFIKSDSIIHVMKTDENTFIPSSNGHHRLYIARKYGLKLIAILDNPASYHKP